MVKATFWTGKPESLRNSLGNPRRATGKTRSWALTPKADSVFGIVPPLSVVRACLPGDQQLVEGKGIQLRTVFRGTKARTQTRTHLGAERASLTPASSPKAHHPPTPGRISFRCPDGGQPSSSPFPNLHCVAPRRVCDV